MCGIAGFLSKSINSDALEATAILMSKRLRHRGPDGDGVWSDPESGLAISHRRLAVIDVSPNGHQPMLSAGERYVIVYNGEIYNHLELRRELENELLATAWRGHADTETMLACIEAWGLEKALSKMVGMFAFALWDRQEKCLTLGRDRFGEKPLYYGWQNGAFLFGSELKALTAHPAFKADIDRNALTLLLRHNCIPAPYSIYEGIFKLPPGNLLRVPASALDKAINPTPYWNFRDVVEQGIAAPFSGSQQEAIGELEQQLLQSVQGQMLSDVPLGAFLSGGIDSSMIAALMQAQSDRPVRTFTVGFDDARYDEAGDARNVAEHLGTDHTELRVQPSDALNLVPDLPQIYCEPFSDSSQLPTYLISKLTRQHVTVALSGDGGDEVFGGYNRYVTARQTWARLQRLPQTARKALAAILLAPSPAFWDRAVSMLPRSMRVSTPGEKAQKLAGVLPLDREDDFYRKLTSHWDDPGSIVIGGTEPATLITDSESWPKTGCFEHWMMAMDARTYLPDDILVKVDRAAMANSLETRAPYLDHRVVELAWRMPLNYKVRGKKGKWLLRQVLRRYVPEELVSRPKAGFAVPLHVWLRGPLRDWAEDLLTEETLRSEGFLRPEPIRKMWAEHLSGQRNWQHHLWTVLMFQAWLEKEGSPV